jgi:signal transduction histidine kinase/ActR/RegA family two-component response regulator
MRRPLAKYDAQTNAKEPATVVAAHGSAQSDGARKPLRPLEAAPAASAAAPMSSPPFPPPAAVATLAARLQSQFIREAAPRELLDSLLPDLLAATGSAHGFIAELVRDDAGAPRLNVLARAREDGIEDEPAFERALACEQPVFLDRGGRALLGVPLFHGRERVGLVALAERDGGYDDALVEHFETLWVALGSIIGSVQLAKARRLADAALRERDALWHRLTDHLPAVIFQYRRSSAGFETMPFATEGLRQLYGLAPAEVRDDARALTARVHAHDRPRLIASIAESARTLQPWRLEFRAESPRGDGMRWHEGHGLPEREADGGTLWHGYIIDITERKRYDDALVTAEAAQRANQAKTEFLSRMSHELRTPLNAVLGFAQLLQMDGTQPMSEVQRTRIAHIERAGGHLLAMINDVLDLSRIEAGTMPLSPEPLVVPALLDDALALVTGQAQTAGVQLMPPTAAPDLVVRADRVRLRQVLVNLLSNAIKYNRPGGLVHLRATRSGPEVLIAVTDTGIGLSPVQVAHLWEPFNRLGAERTTIEGTGIGLALSQRMVQMMDGHLEASSQPERGSTFTVRLPAADTPPGLSSVPLPPSSTSRPSADQRKVIYAEDNPINVELVQQVFQLRPQLHLRVAASGADAIRLARDDPPDLLLLDMHLGDMTGLQVRDRLTAMGITPICIALSADVLPQSVERTLDAGFVEYLAKPLDVAALMRSLDRLLGGPSQLAPLDAG